MNEIYVEELRKVLINHEEKNYESTGTFYEALYMSN